MGLVTPCHRCKKPPRDCRCFDYFARSGMPAAFLPGIRVAVASEAGWHRLSLDLDADVTQEQIRAALSSILAWRDGLRAYQGPWMRGGRNQLLEQMHEEQAARQCSYGKWAERLNFRVGLWLAAHHEGPRWYKRAPPGHDDGNTLPFGIRPEWGLRFATERLRDFGFKDAHSADIIAGALDRLARGKSPFLPGEPISRNRVITAVRAWRRRRRPA